MRIRGRASDPLDSPAPRIEPPPPPPAPESHVDAGAETAVPSSSPEPQKKTRTGNRKTNVHRAHVRTTLTQDGHVQTLDPLVLRSAGAGWSIREEWEERLKAAGLLPLARMMEGTPRTFLDRDLLTALVDRWNPGTHTFQFPWGEMGVSLKDVSMLLGLPIKGEPIANPTAPKNWIEDMDKRFRPHIPGYVSLKKEKDPNDKDKHNSKTKAKEPVKLHGPTLKWLRSTFLKLTGELKTEQSQCALEIYVLWLFGWVMFTSSHGDSVEPRLIQYAMDIAYSKIEDIKEISYGSAVLACLYRANCDSCTRQGKRSTYVGCPLLLNLWSYEYLSLGRPVETVFKHPDSVYKDDVDAPTVGSYWTKSQFKKAKCEGYDFYSENIDTFRHCWVNWNPYTQDKLQKRAPGGLSSLCTRDQQFWLTKRNLLYDVFVEEYAPQRFMRQFDLEQRIPPPLGNPVPEETHAWSRRRNQANNGWVRKRSMDTYIETWRVASDKESLWPSDKPYDPRSFDDYLKWYLQTDVPLCHQFVPQAGQSYIVPANMYRSEAGAELYLAREACSQIEQHVLTALRLQREGHELAEVMPYFEKVMQSLLPWKQFYDATARPRCAELPLNYKADDEAARGCDLDLEDDDEMDENVGWNEENNTLYDGSKLQNDYQAVLGDGGFPCDKDGAAKEDRALEHDNQQDCDEADLQFPAGKNYVSMSKDHSFLETGTHMLGLIKEEASLESMGREPSMEPNVTAVHSMLLQDGGSLSGHEQEQEQEHSEEGAATQGLVMIECNREFPQQIIQCYHRKRKNNPSRASRSARGSPKPGASGGLSCESEPPLQGESHVMFSGVSGATTVMPEPKKRRRTRAEIL